MIGLTMAEQLRRAVMPPDILELQEEINELRRRRIAATIKYFEGGLVNIVQEARDRGAVFG